MSENFQHIQSAHCETGVISTLYKDKGVTISEPIALGIGSGLLFFYAPFVKVMGNPLVSYRSFPGTIFKKCGKRLGVDFKLEKFREPQRGEDRLNELLSKGNRVGIQTNIYWLPYIPEKFRFHFNAHNLVVLEKQGENYIVSDPVVESLEICESRPLRKARFSKGPLGPKGLVYYINETPQSLDWEVAIRKGIKETVRTMLYSPVPIVGVRAIRKLAKDIAKWPNQMGEEKARLVLASVVRMQEEIGTGGAGFRYMYAGFLSEAGKLIGNSTLTELSSEMEKVADSWRDFAILAVGVCKSRNLSSFEEVSKKLLSIADQESQFYKALNLRFIKSAKHN
ncbi:MAG: BtrH N-terminal domain-containing protein [Bdellovibrionales bacterium]|nr:BtrH N-terminal domain-containing protein [Bdellovibrionales bacterium]